jgi:hypothetical protein
VAFMDLSGSYGSVDQELPFWKLEHHGAPTRHSCTHPSNPADLYRGTACTAKWMGAAACPLQLLAACGRAAPNSTTLFNLFIWDLHRRLSEACPGAGVPIGPPPRHRRGLRLPKALDLGYG